jgi:alpha,alpha-trehalase
MTQALDEQAVAIMKANDRGGFTVPTARLYPYQWNWDSAFSALGFARFDRDRAWREIETLFEGQWPNGMVPHILFRRDDPDYFPGPSVWGADVDPPSSGHSQPPVAASIVRTLHDADPEGSRAAALFPKLFAYHRWFHASRDPDGSGRIVCTHPWESGRDNSPDWDAALAAVDPTGVAPFTRRDTGHVDPAMRPTQGEYERYIKLVEYGRGTGWDHARIAAEGPFRVADPGLLFILLRADRDLAALAETLGETAAADEIAGWIARGEAGAERLWDAGTGAYLAEDLAGETRAPGVSSTAFLAFWAGVGDAARQAALAGTLTQVLDACAEGAPSFDPRHPAFDSRRYWRGPVWLVVNYMIGRGLAEQGWRDLAERVRDSSARLVERAGFYEYFDPVSGAGCGGGDFTWTAAIWLAWAAPSARERD